MTTRFVCLAFLLLVLLVSIKQEADNFTEDKPTSSESIQDYTYLSNDKDVALWKMLVSSPSNCNVFVGALSHYITSHILHAAFKAFILNQDDKNQLKAHVVMDITRRQSKGYGFVTFPSRRSTELAMICMQDFEIHGRAMQLGWGQENSEDRMPNAKHFRTSVSKGNIVSDTFYPGAADLLSKQSLKRHCSRWDLESPSKCPKIEEFAEVDQTPSEIIKKPKEKHLLSDKSWLISSCTGQIDAEILNSSHLKSMQNNRGVRWLTHDQKVTLLRSVCSYLRSCGVQGHLGVFGVHYEADNSRLYVVCAKHVAESQLHNEFTVFGDARVKLNCDANGFSKGCAFVQYTESKCAEKAIKQLHGKVVGGMPLKVMVAEPKVLKGSQKKNPVKL